MKLLGPTIIIVFGCVSTTRSDVPPSLHLTQLSSREFVDLSKVSMVRLPVFTEPHGCTDCQTRWGADMIVDGVSIPYSEEAEVTLRRMLTEQK